MVLKSGYALKTLYLRSQTQSSLRLFSQLGRKNKNPDIPKAGVKQDFNPFSVRLEADGKKSPSAISRLRNYFANLTSSSSAGASLGEEAKQKTADDIYQKIKKDKEETKVGPDGKPLTYSADLDKRTKILEMIEKNINRKYFSEKRLGDFFAECFSLKNPAAFVDEDPKFKSFVMYDLKLLIQSLREPENLVEFLKFAVLFRLGGEDPEIYEVLGDHIKKNMNKFTTDQIMTVLVNFSHSLSPEAQEVFDIANEDLTNRLDSNFNAASREIYLQPDDFPKIINTLMDYRQMSHDLKQTMMDYLKENVHNFSYNTLAELCVIFATKMDKNYKKLFFERTFKEKFIKELKYLDQDTFYKILWSLVKAQVIAIDERPGSDWHQIKEAVVSKMKEFDAKTLTNILVLATVAKNAASNVTGDLWDQVEPEVIIKMKSMQLPDLLNLLWASQEIKRGSAFFFQKLEEEILTRIRSVKDEDMQLLIECFAESQSKQGAEKDGEQSDIEANDAYSHVFSEKFVELLLRVLREKKERFQIKTLVHLIWTFAKSPELMSNPESRALLKELRDYERLRQSLGNLHQKSQCILLWTYSRDEMLINREFIQDVVHAMINFDQGRFELDNFDLLLIVQAVSHLERSELSADQVYMRDLYQLVTMAETFVVKNFENLNVQEFTTILLFYLRGGPDGIHDRCLSRALLDKLLAKLTLAADQLNELQLSLFLKALIGFAVRNRDKYDRTKFEPAVNLIDKELVGIQREKELIMSEEKIRETIRNALRQQYGVGDGSKGGDDGEGRPFRPHGTEQDEKLDREMPKNVIEVKEKKVKEVRGEAAEPIFQAEQVLTEQLEKHSKMDEIYQEINQQAENIVDKVTEDIAPDEKSKLKKYLLNRRGK